VASAGLDGLPFDSSPGAEMARADWDFYFMFRVRDDFNDKGSSINPWP
jgi:hypothetical protein